MDISNFIYDPSCVLYLPLWKKDCATGQTLYSDDAWGHQCTVTGATWGKQGRFFDGVSYRIDCGKSLGLSLTNELTIGAWVNPRSVAGVTSILGNMDAAGDAAQYLLRIIAGFPNFYQDAVASVTFTGTSQPVIANHWQFVSAVREGITGRIVLYVNALPDVTTGTSTANSIANAAQRGNTFVGKVGDAALQYHDGYIGDVFMFSRAFTPIEMSNLFLASKGQ